MNGWWKPTFSGEELGIHDEVGNRNLAFRDCFHELIIFQSFICILDALRFVRLCFVLVLRVSGMCFVFVLRVLGMSTTKNLKQSVACD